MTNTPLNYQTVYLDLNGDGRLDPGEPTTQTDDLGNYAFNGLAPGAYTVRVVAYPGTIVTSLGGGSQTVTVAAGQVGALSPFGIIPSSSLLPLSYSPNPFGTSNPDLQTAEVNALYRTILGRAPDATGGANSVAYLKSGGSLAQLSGDLLESIEYDNILVRSFYQNFLNRVPTEADQAAGVAFLQGGGSQDQLAATLFDSTEFNSLFATDTAFVQQLYLDILGRPAEPTGLADWLARLSTGTTRSQVVSGFLKSVESYSRGINGQFNIILGRPVDEAAKTHDIALFQLGATPLNLAVGLFTKPEFVSRANATIA